MNGRYTLTVQYDEHNPNYDHRSGSWPVQEPRMNATVLSCELTPDQFALLKAEVLKVWMSPSIALETK